MDAMDATVMVQQQGIWYLRIVQGPMTGQVLPLERNPAIIGRDQTCDVVITVTGVSRRHAQLSFQEQWFSIQDMGSTNGTFVNGVRISDMQILQPGDLVSLGTEVTFVLEWGTASPGVEQLTLPQYMPVSSASAGVPADASVSTPVSSPAPTSVPKPKSGAWWLWPLIGCGVLTVVGIVVAIVIALMLTKIVPNPFAAKTFTPMATAPSSPTATSTLVRLSTPTPTVTLTPSPTAAPTHTPTSTSTATAVQLPTPELTSTPTGTPEPTATETPTETPTATLMPTPTPTQPPTATPTATPTSTQPPTATPTVTPTTAPLSINWELLEKKCISKEQWTLKFRLTAGGGKGQYVYYRDIDQLYGPTNETQYTYELTYGAKASAVGTFFVESGGQRAENKFWVDHPDCTTYTP